MGVQPARATLAIAWGDQRKTSPMKTFLTILGASALLASAAHAESPPERQLGVEAAIPFASTIGIRNFEADGDKALWIEDNHRLWYRAELISPCWGLEKALKIGFVPRGGGGSLDKFGEIRVDGEKCQLTSLKTSAPPAKVVAQKAK